VDDKDLDIVSTVNHEINILSLVIKIFFIMSDDNDRQDYLSVNELSETGLDSVDKIQFHV